MNEIRNTGPASRIGLAAFALWVSTALVACAPGDGDGQLSVRTLEVRAMGADSLALEGGAIDSTWTIPGDDARQLTRSLVLDPGDQSETPSRLVDLALGALVTALEFTPPSDEDIAEGDARGVLEIPLQPPIAFRTIITANYRQDEDLAWRGTGTFGGLGERPMRWIDGTVNPADTLVLSLEGDFEEVREAGGGGQAILSGRGTLYVSGGGEYEIEVTERVETTRISSARVARRFGDARGEVVPQ